MKRLIVVIISLLFVITGILSLPGNKVYACSCVGGSANAGLEGSTQVFEGKVTKIGDQKPEFGGLREYTFKVYKSWKGVQSNEINIYSYAGGEASCGFHFDKNKTYLVFATNLATNLCSGNLPISQADNELTQLGIGTVISQHDNLDLGSSYWIILVVIAGVILIFISVIGIRRYRKKVFIK
ncbi:hypothetical protein PCCS19_02430 [Paenibacillus sp. CCS19]|uniref:hypothetical protein n=1 Tax=Paenibacillus sp. CCS19 TaxID=3158387 RepID=UPI00255D4241|nr:hypothetical protein [Paenibacillus cellulosilyticus]GMK37190.1 hypothetical protein PCCS19_02430 [Paenibacillus cellulosilyticus]